MTADETPAAPAEDRGQEQATQQAQEHERAQQQNEYSRLRLAAGIVGRTWLWFLAGCLLVTVIPMLFGWRPYVIESGSMSPRAAYQAQAVANSMLATANTAMYSEPSITLSKLPARMPLLTIWRIASGISRSKITWPSSAACESSSQRRPWGEAHTARRS